MQLDRDLCPRSLARRLHRGDTPPDGRGHYLRETDTRNIGAAAAAVNAQGSPEVLDVVGGHGGVGDAVVHDGVHGDGHRVARQDLKRRRGE